MSVKTARKSNRRTKKQSPRTMGGTVAICELIGSVVREICALGIQVQAAGPDGHHNCAWVFFPTQNGVKTFLDIVAPYGDSEDSIYQQVVAHQNASSN